MRETIRDIRPWLVLPAIVVGVPMLFLVLIVSRYALFPNHRTYTVGDVQLVGTLSLFKNAEFNVVEAGGSHDHYSGQTPLFIRFDTTVFDLRSIDLAVLEESSDRIEGSNRFADTWPAGTRDYHLGGMTFWIHDGNVLYFLCAEFNTSVAVVFSTDGEQWFTLPMDQEDANQFLGSDGRKNDHIRW